MKGISTVALENLKRKDLLQQCAFVNGNWLEHIAFDSVVDPATGEEIGCVGRCEVHDVETAIAAASRSFLSWRQMLPLDRGNALRRWSTLVRQNADDLATILVCEQGKPLSEACGEISYGAAFLDWFAAEGERTYGETIPRHRHDSHLSVSMQPIGVTAAITPWNFPSAMILRKAGAALAAGCSMIVKPAPETPLSALALAKLAEEAGIPPGVIQILTGDARKITRVLADRAEVRALSFTGSTEVGRLILERSAKTIKKVSLELGGHAPFIIFPDASFELALEGCRAAKFATSGQDCLAANRIYIHEDIYERFAQAFGTAIIKLQVGHGLEDGVDIGPMTRASVAEKCRQHIADALAKGARCVCGIQELSLGGNFIQPTVLADVREDMLIAREETFGPVAALLSFKDEAEVVRRANDTEMGLAAYVYTQDLNRALRLSENLEYGMVAVNTASFTGAPIPFGGWKRSGLGREGSRHGIAEFMELKYTCFGNVQAGMAEYVS